MSLRCILILDDDPQIQTMLRIAPDANLRDLGLPDRDGKEVLQDIRAFSQVPVIFLYARDREAEKVAALDLGADGYLENPVGISELQALLPAAARHATRERGEVTRVQIGDLSSTSTSGWYCAPADLCG